MCSYKEIIKLFVFLILLTKCSNVFGFSLITLEELDKYRVPCYNTVGDYQELVGKIFTYAPVSNNYNKKIVDYLGTFDRDFVIEKIKKGRKQKMKGVIRTNWTIRDLKYNRLFEIVVYSGNRELLEKYYSDLNWDDEVRCYELPLYDFTDWEKDHANIIGEEFSNSLVKAKYKILNDYLGRITNNSDPLHPVENFDELVLLENTITHQRITLRKKNAQIECFKEDLEKGFLANLTKVEKPDNPEIQYGEIKVVTDSLTKYGYEDNYIDIHFFIRSHDISFDLYNNSPHSLRLLWDEASYVDTYGSTSKIMHNGIKYSEREKAQSPSTIIRGACLSDVAIPTCNVYYSDVLKEWNIWPMYPTTPTDKLYNICLMLPIQIKGVTNEYLFVFEIRYDYLHPDRLIIDKNCKS